MPSTDNIFWSFYDPLMKLGLQKPLEEEDLWGTRTGESAADLARPVQGMVRVWDIFRNSMIFG